MKKRVLKIVLIITLISNLNCAGKDFQNYTVKKYSPQWACCLENYINQHIEFRETIYNALGLNDEQKKVFIDSLSQNAAIYREKAEIIAINCEYLEELIECEADKAEIKAQKRIIKENLKALNSLIKAKTKELRQYMTKQQAAKYKLITFLEKNDVNKECRFKDYYKKNPQMQKFGDVR